MGKVKKTKIICLLLGGKNYEIKGILFELHPYCGPTPVSRKTLSPLNTGPSPSFFDLIERWELGGSLVEDHEYRINKYNSYEKCIVPEWCSKCKGTGSEIQHLGGKHYLDKGECKNCNGTRLEQKTD